MIQAHDIVFEPERLAPLRIAPYIRQDLNCEERGNRGTLIGRMDLATNEAHALDAPNPYGFAATAVTAVLADLYTAANYQN